MFDVLDDVATQLEKISRELEPSALDGRGARALLRKTVGIERRLHALKVLATRRIETSGTRVDSGHRSIGSFVAAVTGTSLGAANKLAQTAVHVAASPVVGDAMRSGALSPAQLAEIAPAAVAAPEKAEHLVETAMRTGFAALRDEVQRVIAAADPQAHQARSAKATAERSVRFWTQGEVGHIKVQAPLHTYGELKTAIEGEARRVFAEASREGRREPHEAYCVDALARLVANASHGAPKSQTPKRKPARNVHLHVLVDLEALRRGWVIDGETCEIPGVGPVPVSVARDYLGDAFLTLVLRKGKDITTVAHAGRYISTEIRTALALQVPECIVEDCGNRGYLEHDHHEGYAKGGPTSYWNLGPMCRPHNVMKEQGYALGPPDPHTGKRKLHPPGPDPP